jgi:hypothetical protein
MSQEGIFRDSLLFELALSPDSEPLSSAQPADVGRMTHQTNPQTNRPTTNKYPSVSAKKGKQMNDYPFWLIHLSKQIDQKRQQYQYLQSEPHLAENVPFQKFPMVETPQRGTDETAV